MTETTLAFLGGGNMAASLIAGLIADGYNPERILVGEPDSDKRGELNQRFGVRTTADNQQVCEQADILVLALKPQSLGQAAREAAASLGRRRPLVISVAAGIRIAHLKRWLGNDLPIVRCMPNTPAMLQAGATVLFASPDTPDHLKDSAESILRAVGLTRWVNDEGLMDAVTALSGSGPAYFFLVMEAMEQAGIDLGLDREDARLLTLQTALGAARMALESSDAPARLRQKVTSPGGTTEQAIAVLENGGLQTLFRQALSQARLRSIELSNRMDEAS